MIWCFGVSSGYCVWSLSYCFFVASYRSLCSWLLSDKKIKRSYARRFPSVESHSCRAGIDRECKVEVAVSSVSEFRVCPVPSAARRALATPVATNESVTSTLLRVRRDRRRALGRMRRARSEASRIALGRAGQSLHTASRGLGGRLVEADRLRWSG